MSKNKHVVPSSSGWSVKSGGVTMSNQRTQKEAISTANRLAKFDRSEVVIHGRDGRIREKNSFGNDPFPPKG